MEDYGDATYGDAFADVYDEWYPGVDEIADVVAAITALVADAGGGPVLELGIGTGRLAVALADAGLVVHGVDTSAAMLARLAAKDPGRRVRATVGDMVEGLPDGPFAVVLVAYNTLFNLRSADRQHACFTAVADRLVPGGAFVVEAFVPDDPPRAGDVVGVRELTADRVVLSISRHRPDEQVAEGQYVEITEAGGVRLRPWSIRYASPAELDGMAKAAGLRFAHRWRRFDRSPFTNDSARHITVFTKP